MYPLFIVFLDPPRLNLSFGLSMNAELIDEGKDVYFMCEIEANPEVYKIGWRHGVSFNSIIFKSNYCKLIFNHSLSECKRCSRP
jgi:hypothetical protein